ncbi:VOC family protein [Cellulomonas sp. NPDC089187]|uniref:VOC family protein n=1 Tax=Cellulomonas sp. NPDC089187 TaxID=3154970 RepID=UPI0034277D82
MTVRDQPWPEGTPSFAELNAPDLDAAEAFYGPLFGWTFERGPAEMNHYTTASLRGRTAAAFNPPMSEAPTAWLTHLSTADVTAATARAAAAGAQVLLAPMPVMEFGDLAVIADPQGAVFALWQAGSDIGAQVVNEPGAMVWNEHMSRDLAAAQDFYRVLFGYHYDDMSAPGFDYATFATGDRPLGGMGGGSEIARWVVTFAVSDTDASVATALDLGGSVRHAPEDSPYGRIAGLTGPFGERFYLMSTDEPSTPE